MLFKKIFKTKLVCFYKIFSVITVQTSIHCLFKTAKAVTAWSLITIFNVPRFDLAKAIRHGVESLVLRPGFGGHAVGLGAPATTHEIVEIRARVRESTLMAVHEKLLRVVPVGIPQGVGHAVARLGRRCLRSGAFWLCDCHLRVTFTCVSIKFDVTNLIVHYKFESWAYLEVPSSLQILLFGMWRQRIDQMSFAEPFLY